jgi:hypothetical protein
MRLLGYRLTKMGGSSNRVHKLTFNINTGIN